jgi:hypothetical protein
MENGATGICLFTPDRMKAEHWEAIEWDIYRLLQKVTDLLFCNFCIGYTQCIPINL